MRSAQKSESRTSPRSTFLELAERYAAVITEERIHLRPTRVPDHCPIFDALLDAEKEGVLERLRSDLELFNEVKNEGAPLRDSSKLVWRYLSRSKLTPCSDIFDKIEKDDVVSIYDIQQRQVFQNMRFLELVSVTLEQLFCSSWYQYSTRASEIEQSLYETAKSILTGEIKTTIAPPAPEHIAQEIDTEGLVKLRIKVKWASPVFFEGNTFGMLVINRCTRID
ncbi:MAG: hypothetical protein P4M08_12010 [Oligoflexia bacterium]|nr:hypothetical protein [Oligoflexia bacterium]